MTLRHLDLFSGIGGFALAARMVGGYETVAFCEIDPYAQAVLRKHWPGVPVHDDVRRLPHIPCDVITAGFPCQDISNAGGRAGIDGERSGLWHELPPIIGAIRPRYVLLENVSALLGRGLSRVLGDLAEIGYDAEWHCVPAAYVGAPHIRDRVWIVAYPQHSDADSERPYRAPGDVRATELRDEQGGHARPLREDVADAAGAPIGTGLREPDQAQQRDQFGHGSHALADAGRARLPLGAVLARVRGETERGDEGEDPAVGGDEPGRSLGGWLGNQGAAWAVEPDVGRVAHGVPARVDRLRALGNAIVPQVAAIFLEAIREVSGDIS